MAKLTSMINIGKEMENKLNSIDICTAEELIQIEKPIKFHIDPSKKRIFFLLMSILFYCFFGDNDYYLELQNI